MKYIVQSNHEGLPWEPPPESGWRPVGNGPYQGHDDLDKAIHAFEIHADLARNVWPARVVDSDGKVYKSYDPEQDTRLPGCRWRIIQKNAYHLWDAAGRPVSDGVAFWEKAEAELKEHNGVS